MPSASSTSCGWGRHRPLAQTAKVSRQRTVHGLVGAQDVGQDQSVARIGFLARNAMPVALVL
ncbi:hypothetical protein Z951_43780 [Streptomyces sp. PRh5]|nr:hypothetical protein Z951_43780 [Streptomyces sp. PRh5]